MATTNSSSPDAVLRGHLTDVQAAAFVRPRCRAGAPPTTLLLATGSLDGVVLVWAADGGGAPLLRWVAHGSGVAALASPEPGVLWSQGRDGWVYRWALAADVDAWGALALHAPAREAALPVGFGSFCRMSVLRGCGGGAALVAAPSLNSEAIEVWAAGGAAAAGGGDAAARQRVPGVVTPVHIESAAPGAFTQPPLVACDHVATICLAPRRAPPGDGGDEGGGARVEPAAALGSSVTAHDDAYHYSPESEQRDAAAAGHHDAGALSRLQRQSGMLTCVQLLEPGRALGGAAPGGGAGPGRPVPSAVAAAAAECAQAPEVLAAAATGAAADDLKTSTHAGAADGGLVSHPWPAATSLRELLAMAAAAQPEAATERPGSASGGEAPTARSRTALANCAPALFLLAASYENGHLYVLSDRPPAHARAAAAAHAAAGLAALRELDELEDAGGTQDDASAASACRPAAATTRGRVLIDLRLSTDPIFTFTLDAAYRTGVGGGAGGDLVLFALDIPARTAHVTRRIALATPGVSVSTLLPPGSSGDSDSDDDEGDASTSLAITGGWDHTARVVDLTAGVQVAELQWHSSSIYALAAAGVSTEEEAGGGLRHSGDAALLSADAGEARLFRVATGAKDGRVALWTISVACASRS